MCRERIARKENLEGKQNATNNNQIGNNKTNCVSTYQGCNCKTFARI